MLTAGGEWKQLQVPAKLRRRAWDSSAALPLVLVQFGRGRGMVFLAGYRA